MNILVTGGAGFIGSHLVDALIERGYKVRILDNLDPQVHKGEPEYLNKEAELIKGDIRSLEDVKKALEGVEAVFHFAAAVGVGQSMYQIRHYVEVNTLGTANLLEALIEKKRDVVRKLIVASSMSVYGEGQYSCPRCGTIYPPLRAKEQLKERKWEMRCPICGEVASPRPTDENKPLYPNSIYAISKRDQEEMCLVVGRAYGIPTVALRFFNVYGPRQALSNPYTGVAAIFSSRILNQRPPVVFEDGRQARDFIHVRDVVQANLLCLEREEADLSAQADFQVFNVGTGRPVTILDLARSLLKKLGSSLEPEVKQTFREGDIRYCYADITRIKERLGFSPQVSLEEGMGDLVEWVRSQKAEDKFEEALQELEEKGLA